MLIRNLTNRLILILQDINYENVKYNYTYIVTWPYLWSERTVGKQI